MSESLPYSKLDENGKVICQICGKSFLVISPKHLMKIHDVTFSQYRSRYPDAPLSSEEFRSRGKFGKLGLFKKGVQEDVPIIEDIIEDDLDEEPVKELKKFEVVVNLPEEKQDPISKTKRNILKFLKDIFYNIEPNYVIRKFHPDGRLEYEFITDFADPILKIDFEFPKVFWHNKDRYEDLNRKIKLQSGGWKIIEISSISPSIKDITKVTDSIN